MKNFSFTRTKKILKQYPSLKQAVLSGKIMIFLFGYMLIVGMSIFAGFFNYYFFFLNSLKYLSCIIVTWTIIYITIDYPDAIEDWKENKSRIETLKGKFILSVFFALFLFITIIATLILIHLSGFAIRTARRYELLYPDVEYPFNYHPSLGESIMIGFIILFTILAIITSIYWTCGRFIQIKGYNPTRKVLKLNLPRIGLGWLIHIIVWGIIFPIYFDHTFLDIRFGDPSNRWSLLAKWFGQNPSSLLVIQLCTLIIINLFYWLDGRNAIRNRTNFVVIGDFN